MPDDNNGETPPERIPLTAGSVGGAAAATRDALRCTAVVVIAMDEHNCHPAVACMDSGLDAAHDALIKALGALQYALSKPPQTVDR